MKKRGEKFVKKGRSIKNFELSGLGNLIKNIRLMRMRRQSHGNRKSRKRRLLFTQNSGDSWFYAAGQSGSGKTHICTAICTRFISTGRLVKYKVWRNLFHELQSNQFDETEYKNKFKSICDTDILYIDDFLKSNSNNSKFSDELNFAFEIINSRYNANKKQLFRLNC